MKKFLDLQRFLLLLGCAVCIALVIIGSQPERPGRTETVKNIGSVHMHEPSHLSVWIADAHNIRRRNDYSSGSGSPIYLSYIPDAPKGQLMWMKVFYGSRGSIWAIELHTHSDNEIQGGGWDKGKFGRGETVSVP